MPGTEDRVKVWTEYQGKSLEFQQAQLTPTSTYLKGALVKTDLEKGLQAQAGGILVVAMPHKRESAINLTTVWGSLGK